MNPEILGTLAYSRADPQIILVHSTLYCYNIDEISQELNPCLYQLSDGNIGFVINCFTSSHRTDLLTTENLL